MKNSQFSKQIQSLSERPCVVSELSMIEGGVYKFTYQDVEFALSESLPRKIWASEVLNATGVLVALTELEATHGHKYIGELGLRELDYYLRDDNRTESFEDNEYVEAVLKFYKGTLGQVSSGQSVVDDLEGVDLATKVKVLKDLIEKDFAHEMNYTVELVDIDESEVIVHFTEKQELEEKLELLQQYLNKKYPNTDLNVIPEY